jgi:hypothetical protein
MRRTIFVMGTLIFLGPLLFIGFLHSGSVHGVEYSPDLYCHRSFHYFQLFGLHVTRTHVKEWYSNVDRYLHDSGFVQPRPIANPRWLLSKGFAPGVRGWFSEVKVLCHSLGCFGGKDKKWVEWSEANPELAAEVWPVVVKWIDKERYAELTYLFLISDLIEAKTVDEVRTLIEISEKNGSTGPG